MRAVSSPSTWTLVVLLSSLCAFAHADLSDEVTEVDINNRTDFTIKYLFVSPADSDLWGVDILDASSVLDSGYRQTFYAHYPEACGYFDVLAIDEDGDTFQVAGAEVCDGAGAAIDISVDNFQLLADDGGFRRMELQIGNDTGEQLDFLFVSPADSEMLGIDVLGSQRVMPDGAGLTVVVPAERGAAYDVVAVSAGGRRYHFELTVDPRRVSGQAETVLIEPSDEI